MSTESKPITMREAASRCLEAFGPGFIDQACAPEMVGAVAEALEHGDLVIMTIAQIFKMQGGSMSEKPEWFPLVTIRKFRKAQ